MARPKKNAGATSKQMTNLPVEVQVPEVGGQPFHPASPQDSYIIKMVAKIAEAQKGGGILNPVWDDAKELAMMKAVGFSSMPQTIVQPLNERFAKRHPVSDLNQPRDPTTMQVVALQYCYESPFVARAIRIKTDFTVKDFKHRTHHEDAKAFYDKKAIDLSMYVTLRKIVWLLYGVGISPVYWGGEEGPITDIRIFDPRQCHIQDVFGKTKLWLKISNEMIDAVKDPTGRIKSENKAVFETMPKYWVDQIKEVIKDGAAGGYSNKKLHLIEIAEGSYSVIENRYAPMNRTIHSLDGVPLQPAFESLQRYKLLAAGDFAVAWNVKNMITLISEGDPKADPKDYVPLDNARMQNLYQAFINPDQSLQIFCDPTTRVEYVIPPIDVFKQEKYKQVEKEIKMVLNLPDFMWGDDSNSNYANSIAQLKLLREEVDAMRMLLRECFFRPLYQRLREKATRPGFAAKDTPLPVFDQNSLRDDATWLQDNSELYGAGGLSLRTLCEVYGWDYDYEMAELKKEHEELGTNLTNRANTTHAQPIFEPSQGNSPKAEDPNAAPPGRPAEKPKPDQQQVRTPRSGGK